MSDCLLYSQHAQAQDDHARQFIFEHYTWEHTALKLLDIYNAVLQQKPIPVLYST